MKIEAVAEEGDRPPSTSRVRKVSSRRMETRRANQGSYIGTSESVKTLEMYRARIL